MNDRLLKMWIGAQIRMRNFWDDLKSEENGAAELITIALLVVVIIALVVIFRKRLEGIIGSVFDQTDDAVKTLGQ